MEDPICETSHMGFKIRIFSNRVEYKPALQGTKSIPLSQIASIELGMPLVAQIVVTTNSGEKVKMPCKMKAKKEVQAEIHKLMT